MDPLSELLAIENIKKLKARYFYFVDIRDWTSWLTLFTPDVTIEWDRAVSTGGRDGDTVDKVVGVDEIRQRMIVEALEGASTVHHGHTPIIELVSETEARGIWAMEDTVLAPGGRSHGYGHYHETYRKLDDEWKIAAMHLTMLFRTHSTW